MKTHFLRLPSLFRDAYRCFRWTGQQWLRVPEFTETRVTSNGVCYVRRVMKRP